MLAQHTNSLMVPGLLQLLDRVPRLADLGMAASSDLTATRVVWGVVKPAVGYRPKMAIAAQVAGHALVVAFEFEPTGQPITMEVRCDCEQGAHRCPHARPALELFAGNCAKKLPDSIGIFQSLPAFRSAGLDKHSLDAAAIGHLPGFAAARSRQSSSRATAAERFGLCLRPDNNNVLMIRPCALDGAAPNALTLEELTYLLAWPGQGERKDLLQSFVACDAIELLSEQRETHTNDQEYLQPFVTDIALMFTAIRQLAAKGSVVDMAGRPITVAPAPFFWRATSQTAQRLQSDDLDDVAWLPNKLIGLDQTNSCMYLIPGGEPTLRMVAGWPELENDHVSEVAEAIERLGAAVPIPSPVDLGEVEEVTAGWVVVLEFVPGAYGSPQLKASLVAKAGELEIPYTSATSGLQELDGKLVSLQLPLDPIAAFHGCGSHLPYWRGVQDSPSGTRVLRESYLGDSRWDQYQSLIEFQAAGFDVICRGFTPPKVISHVASLPVPVPHVRVGPADALGHHPVAMTFEINGQTIDPDLALVRGLIDQVLIEQHHGMPGEETNRAPDANNTLEIQPNLFVCADLHRWALALLPYIHLHQSTYRKGKKKFAAPGAIIAAVLGGAQLHFEVAGDDPTDRLADLRAAKTGGGVVDVPGVKLDYLPFQLQAIDWILRLRHYGWSGILADDRGSGKTLDSLGAALVHRAGQAKRRGRPPKHPKPRPPVIVAVERRDYGTWVRELQDNVSGLDWARHLGPKRAKSAEELRGKDLILTTYGVMSRDMELLLSLAPELVFLDEANSLKNSKSAKSRDVARFTGATVLPITGTPVDHHPAHLHALMDVAMPGLLGKSNDFAALQKCLAKYGGNQPLARAERKRVAKVLAPFLLRRTKAELKEFFPEKRVQPIIISLDKAGATSYRSLRQSVDDSRTRLLAKQPFSESRFELNAMLLHLRKACARVGTPRQMTDKGRFLVDLTMESLESGDKVVVFTHFNGEAVAIVELLRKAGINTGQWLGSDSPATRDRESVLFRQGHIDVLVIGPYGARGLDLPQASCCIIADPWIDITTDDQMGDRVHRLSSQKDVTIYRLALAGTIEELALAFAQGITETSEAVLTGDNPSKGSATGLQRSHYDQMFEIQPDID